MLSVDKVTSRRASEDERAKKERDVLERSGPEELRRRGSSSAGQNRFEISENLSRAERRKSSLASVDEGTLPQGRRRSSVY